MTRSVSLFTGVGLLLALTSSLASATSIVARAPEQLAQESALVVDGRVTAVRSYWNDDHSKIFTEAAIAVDGTHKGSAASSVRIVQLGGVVGNVRMTAHGALAWTRGEEVLLFLEPSDPGVYQVAGFSQGKYTIERDARTGKAFVRQALPADVDDARAPATSSSAGTAGAERVTLEQFLNRVLPQR